MDERDKLLFRARWLTERLQEAIALLESGEPIESHGDRIHEAWKAFSSVRNDQHAARMVWLIALDMGCTLDVAVAVDRHENSDPLSADQQKMLARNTLSLKAAQLLLAVHTPPGHRLSPTAQYTIEHRLMMVRTCVKAGLPESADAFTDEQITRLLDVWARLGGATKGAEEKWDELARLIDEAGLGELKGSSLRQEWKVFRARH